MRPAAFAALLVSTSVLSGCAGSIAGVSIGSISSFAGFASTIFTGADLGEHAASLVTGKSCRFSEGLVRDDRAICEERGSEATRGDFHGIFVERIEPDGTVIYAAPTYMPASVGAGENENDPAVIWAQIKQQKANEEVARKLAGEGRGLHIDVAALAAGQLPGGSMGFLPASAGVGMDEEPAGLTAARPRDLSNPADPTRSASKVRVVSVAAAEPPAIDERTLTLSMKIAQATGAGGPFIAPVAGSKPVSSKLVNGEPVLVMRIAPIVSPVAFNAVPEAAPDASTEATSFPETEISSLPDTADLFLDIEAEPAPLEVEPVAPRAKPKVRQVEIAKTERAPAKKKAAAPRIPAEDEAFLPASDAVISSDTSVQAISVDPPPVAAAPREKLPLAAPVPAEREPAATGGPAPLFAGPQP
jgi:hypothetical protein